MIEYFDTVLPIQISYTCPIDIASLIPIYFDVAPCQSQVLIESFAWTPLNPAGRIPSGWALSNLELFTENNIDIH